MPTAPALRTPPAAPASAGRPWGGLRAQGRALVALGCACLALTAVTLVVCVDALVLHDVGLHVQALALVAGGLALSSFGLAAQRLACVLVASRRLARRLPVVAGPAVGGIPTQTVRDPAPSAFCLGLLRPRIVVSTGARERLDAPALAAVVAHERHHARRRDGLRRVLADAAVHALGPFAAPDVARRRYEMLLELQADRSASGQGAGTHGLATALLSLDGPGHGIEPERVRFLLDPASLPAPAWSALRQGAALVLVLLVLVVAIVASTRCVDIFYLQERDATQHRWWALGVVAAAAGALLWLRLRLARRAAR